MGYTDAVPVNALAKRAMDTMYLGGNKVAGVDLIAISQAYQTYPGGQNFPLQVGVLSLGCQFLKQTFDRDNGSSVNATFISSFTFTTGMTASYSYGMHIGSASLGIKGSLLLGGYDSNRVVGDTSAQPYEGASFPINLLDIGIGVATGGSPWDYSSRTGLLGKSNSSLHSGITVKASLGDPYIYLPKSSCDAITADLPTTYDSDLGLYLWNTSDPRYEKIITSPTYLSFEFSKNSLNNANITIKVPFALLNLTLEAPLVKTPTPYFPCMGTDSTPALGRAFFQAAFVGVNWGSRIGNWFLAQAPGPDYFPTSKTVSIEEDDLAISGTKSSWEATWASYWTPIAASPSSSSSSSSATAGATPSAEDRNGMSTGAKAGIAVGCAVACILLIVLACLYFRRRWRARNASPTSKNIGPALSGIRVKHVEGVYELSERSRPHELAGESSQPRELSNDNL